VVPLVEWHDELVVCVEDQPLVTRPGGWVGEVRWQPQRSGPIEAAELATRASLSAHNEAAIRYSALCVTDKRS
jgi:hypothetical protein